jgi:hypothetical protein
MKKPEPGLYETYFFSTREERAAYRVQIEKSGVEYDILEGEEVIAHTTIYLLGLKRTSPTLKQQLSTSTKV